MGLFSKKPPCAICGGKVGFLFPTKIEGEYICDDCSNKIDMEQCLRDDLTMEGLRQYMAFYEENRGLAEKFTVSAQVDVGPGGHETVFDCEHGLFCMDETLEKLVFQGGCLKGFTISEDRNVIFEGTAAGLTAYESVVPQRLQAMEPEISMIRMQQEMDRRRDEEYRQMERMYRDGRDGRPMPPPPPHHSYPSIHEPFEKFRVHMELDHPYYHAIDFERSGPSISSFDPDLNHYADTYHESYGNMQLFAEGLMQTCFPGTSYIDPHAPAAPAREAPAQTASVGTSGDDAIEQIKKYKGLLDAGVITQEEFDAKKKQLMGI